MNNFILFIWYERNKAFGATNYFFTQRDMCPSCDNRIGDWRAAKDDFIVLSTQVCNRDLESTADQIALLEKTEAEEQQQKLSWKLIYTLHPPRNTHHNITRIRIPMLSYRTLNDFDIERPVKSSEWQKNLSLFKKNLSEQNTTIILKTFKNLFSPDLIKKILNQPYIKQNNAYPLYHNATYQTEEIVLNSNCNSNCILDFSHKLSEAYFEDKLRTTNSYELLANNSGAATFYVLSFFLKFLDTFPERVINSNYTFLPEEFTDKYNIIAYLLSKCIKL